LQLTNCPPNPATRTTGGSVGSPKVSYASSIPPACVNVAVMANATRAALRDASDPRQQYRRPIAESVDLSPNPPINDGALAPRHTISRACFCGPHLRILRMRALRSSAPTHDLAHLATNSLAANRWIRA